jgi:GT2 family glycosyltransferase
MVEHAARSDAGLVGAVLIYPNNSIQHMGIALGYTGIAGHPNRGESKEQCVPGDCFQVSAVTFACAVISKSKYWEIGALDEKFPSGFNDVDISIRSANHNYNNIVCVKTELTHQESQSRPRALSPAGFLRAVSDVCAILRKHNGIFREPFFEPHTFVRKPRSPRKKL